MTKEEAEEYIDNYLSHVIEMSEYGNWFSTEIKGMCEDCKNECDKILNGVKICNTKKICKSTEKEILIRLEELLSDITDFILSQTNDLINIENDWISKNVEKPLGISLNYSNKAASVLLAIPIATAGIVGELGKTISDRLYNIYHQKIMQSYVSGSSFDDIETEYDSRFSSFYRGLEADTQTLGSSLSSQYERIIYTSNKTKIKGYVWSSILDTNTCLACGELDGRKFTDISKVLIYPVHDRCRCTVIPFTEEIEDVIPESYSEWFEKQDDSSKRKILGKTRFQLYEGGMKIKHFVNNGKITPLKDLRK